MLYHVHCFSLLLLFFSSELKCKMKFAIYLPPKAESGKCPVLYWLSGILKPSFKCYHNRSIWQFWKHFLKKKIKWAKTFLLASYLDITLINWTGNYAKGRIVKQTCMCFCVTGLTCTEQNFITKSGSQRAASEHGIIIVAPDTSPREWKGDSYTHKTHT